MLRPTAVSVKHINNFVESIEAALAETKADRRWFTRGGRANYRRQIPLGVRYRLNELAQATELRALAKLSLGIQSPLGRRDWFNVG